ncbi:hypothetical protein [cf. Phormidesmis sp. LEGE 11477]|uniref:hypothetical protein n=1 Tax=cf. Phormidesmis sp. LEGE 11477 TaxID=1828680 RepID=UPI00187E5763|nr:hypothetical protein [cf. Phormidesmis sp. LEGE 11477]MBE9059657.1 hypothetical protein [cf. Phormidesmis sp. LEGE 11477]
MKTTSILNRSNRKRLLRRALNVSMLSVTLAFILLSIAQTANAQTLECKGKFHRIDQPTSLKAGVATTGLGMIGLELWWFLSRKIKSKTEK